ncbi:MAG: hypothetical protein N3E51_02510 [Candidatus Micrarchaeota archaeon]|nr:hypothetical protein [Candidatus Micrarchaeota archaeon]
MIVIGKHTAVSEKGLRLSPFQMNFGHRCRVIEAAEALALKNVKRHDLEKGGKLIGRTVVLEGDYDYCIGGGLGGRKRKGKIRLALLETQMGMGASQITQTEYASCAKRMGAGKAGQIFQIRVGTALGINSWKKPRIRIGHLVIPETNVFFCGAVMQSLRYTPPADLSKLEKGDLEVCKRFLEHWRRIGGELTKDGRYLLNKNSAALTEALRAEAEGAGVTYHLGRCFSKDSLYGEDLGYMVELGRRYRIATSEMEQGMNAFIANLAWHTERLRIHSAAVLVQVGECWKDADGALHGKGFPETRSEKNRVAKAMEAAYKIAANALARLKEGIG